MPGNVLFGTHSFWEGVDIQGEALSCVVIARLPFAAPTDPINSARCEQIADRGGKPFYDFSLPMTALKLRQGFGRLIRHRLDRGTVIIADTRFVTKSYGGFLRKSMPLSPKKCFSAEEIFGSLK
jgi:ATP-dependent DNA helicase DinG